MYSGDESDVMEAQKSIITCVILVGVVSLIIRILVRESGTEPVVRVMVEAPDHDTCQKYVDEVVNVICEKGYKV